MVPFAPPAPRPLDRVAYSAPGDFLNSVSPGGWALVTARGGFDRVHVPAAGRPSRARVRVSGLARRRYDLQAIDDAGTVYGVSGPQLRPDRPFAVATSGVRRRVGRLRSAPVLYSAGAGGDLLCGRYVGSGLTSFVYRRATGRELPVRGFGTVSSERPCDARGMAGWMGGEDAPRPGVVVDGAWRRLPLPYGAMSGEARDFRNGCGAGWIEEVEHNSVPVIGGSAMESPEAGVPTIWRGRRPYVLDVNLPPKRGSVPIGQP